MLANIAATASAMALRHPLCFILLPPLFAPVQPCIMEGWKEVIDLLTKDDYDDLFAISHLPEGMYKEGHRPVFLTGSHEHYLIESRLIERITLCPPDKEPEYPQGLYAFQVSPVGYHEMALFEKQSADDKRERTRFYITVVLAILALPGVFESAAVFVRALR